MLRRACRRVDTAHGMGRLPWVFWVMAVTGARAVVHLMDIPGMGDTAFPSVRRRGAHRFLLANYTSPRDQLDFGWLQGQTDALGTHIYLATLTFVPVEDVPPS